MAEVALAAQVRRAQGSSDSRRLRASGKIPAVLYGHGIAPTPLAVEARALRQALNTEAGLNALIQLEVEGKKHLALPRDLQRHPVRNTVAHVDFQVVRRDEMMTVEVPIHFVGEAEQVQKAGGMVEHLLQSLTLESTPDNIPPNLQVDISGLTLDRSIRVGDIALPKNVTTNVDPEEVVVTGAITRAAAAEGEGTEGEAGGGDSAESAGTGEAQS